MVRVEDEDPRAGIEIPGEVTMRARSVAAVRVRVDGGLWFDVPRTDPFVITSRGVHRIEVRLDVLLSGNRNTIPLPSATIASAEVVCSAGVVTQLAFTPELVEVGRRPMRASDVARSRENHVVDPDHPFDPIRLAPPDSRRAVVGKPRIPDADPRAGWFPDPSERHELRYHDGTTWTLFVDDHGETDADTL